MAGNELFGKPNQQDDLGSVTGEDALKLLVGEEGKYASVEDLAKAMLHSQQHVAKLEEENGSFREQAGKAATMQDILAELQAKQAGGQDPAANKPTQDDPSAQPQGGDQPSIEELIEQQLAQRSKADQAKANKEAVIAKLSEKLGDGAAEAYTRTGGKLGVDLDKLSAESPEAVVNLVMGTPTSGHGTPRSGAGHQQQPSAQHQMSYKAIQEQFQAGKITRAQKHQLEMSGLDELGPDAFWKE